MFRDGIPRDTEVQEMSVNERIVCDSRRESEIFPESGRMTHDVVFVPSTFGEPAECVRLKPQVVELLLRILPVAETHVGKIGKGRHINIGMKGLKRISVDTPGYCRAPIRNSPVSTCNAPPLPSPL